MKNLKEFKALIKKYESITLQDLEKSKEDVEEAGDLDEDEISDVLEKITNFGTKDCTLCNAIKLLEVGSIHVCQDCTWVELTNDICMNGINSESYNNIEYATSLHELKEAIEKRAKYMKKVLK